MVEYCATGQDLGRVEFEDTRHAWFDFARTGRGVHGPKIGVVQVGVDQADSLGSFFVFALGTGYQIANGRVMNWKIQLFLCKRESKSLIWVQAEFHEFQLSSN